MIRNPKTNGAGPQEFHAADESAGIGRYTNGLSQDTDQQPENHEISLEDLIGQLLQNMQEINRKLDTLLQKRDSSWQRS